MTTKIEKQARDILGLTEGAKNFQAAVLYLRANGATTKDVMEATGSGPQLNILTRVRVAGHTVLREKRKADGQTVYRIKLVAKDKGAKNKKQK